VLVRVDGLDTYYTLEGDGPPVLLLHGWGTSSQNLAGLVTWLSPECRVLAVDLPGFGWSDPPPAAWASTEYAAHVRQLLDRLGIQAAAVVGHSFGGRVALRLAAETPDRVSRLVLVAAAGIRPPRTARYYVRVGVAKVLKTLAALPGLDRLGQRLAARWAGRVGSRDYKAAGRMRPTLVRSVNEDLGPVLSQIQAPTLLLWGDGDPEVGRAAVLRMAGGIRAARLLVLPGAGHFPFLDAPERFRDALIAFLREGRS
jgi:pimeloyl-ACP methyl ester carboxylesterase